MEVLGSLFLVVAVAAFGGVFARLVKLPNLVGFIISGLLFGILMPDNLKNISSLSEIGTILLLFSIGLVLSFDSLAKYYKVAVIGSIIQIVVCAFVYWLLLMVFGFESKISLVLAMGFSLSSTAVVVKILTDRGEMETIHAQIMMGWLLVQDLVVIPIMIILPVLGVDGANFMTPLLISLLKAVIVILLIVTIGKIVIPYVIHRVSETNSRELLLLTALTLAFGTSYIASLFGVSPALGAFLAGVLLSEGQENHAIFAETRPLRDLFMAIFFVTLGFSVDASVITNSFFGILITSISIVLLKSVITLIITTIYGYKGKTAVLTGIGLSNVSEFSFVIFTSAATIGIIDLKDASFGIVVSLVTLMISSIVYKFGNLIWRKIRIIKFFAGGENKLILGTELENHIIICGYGRVGKWIGKALTEFKIPFVVVEYDKSIVDDLKKNNINVLYGDPSEPEVMDLVNLPTARMLILAIPDHVAQVALINYVQVHAPNVKIISRVHSENDLNMLRNLKISKLVQPEFEASISIIKSILTGSKKDKDEISLLVKRLRMSHSK